MFKEFFIQELGSGLKKPMVYIFTFIMTLLVFGAVASDNVVIGGTAGQVYKNAPHIITMYCGILTIFGLLIATAFFNNAALKDFNSNFSEILFATPISKSGYYFGRFFGALILSTIPLLGIFLGFYLGAVIGPFAGWIDADRIGEFYPESFINNYFLFILPNMFFAGAITFAMASKWKSTVISFVGTMVIIIAYLVSGTLVSDIDNETIAALTDTFGIRAYGIDSKYYTPLEKNTMSVGFNGLLFLNRLIWLAIGVVIALGSYFSFSFINKNKKVKKQKDKTNNTIIEKIQSKPISNIVFKTSTSFKQFTSFFTINFYSIVKSTLFKILFIISALLLIVTMWGGFEYFGLKSYPVTYKMIDSINGITGIFVMIIMVFFSGELVWRDRGSKINEVIDATPHNSMISLLAKSISLICVTSILNLFFILCGILYQLANGYTNLELGVYFQDFIYTSLPAYIIWSAVLVFFQVIINKKYVAYFVSILFIFLLDILLLVFEWQSNMVSVGSGPSLMYSDMNGFGAALYGSGWFNIYWILFGALLLVFSGLIWVRGVTFGFKNRLKSAKKHLTPKYTLGFATVLILWVATASFVFYNTKVLNTYLSSDETEEGQVKYENTYKKYEGINQPKITKAKYVIDIFPEERRLMAMSALILENKSNVAIDSIHFNIDKDWKMKIHLKNAELVFKDTVLDYYIYQLDKPLAPKEMIPLVVEAAYITTGFENEVSNTSIAQNGTFINNFSILPSIGYNESYEIGDKNTRKKYDLKPKLRMPKLESDCGKGCNVNYLSNGMSDWIDVETYISTSIDQVAIAPGSLIKEWTENGRNYYHYKADHKAQNFFNFMSARYKVMRKKWNGIDIEVYYDDSHEYNVEMMSNAVQRSLKYYTENFGPYYHKQARIIEFPRYASFAQAFPGTMPYSESIGFIVNLENENDNNIIDAVIAHEMAHQWWAHQVVGSTMQGATMFSESFSEYSSLMVMKHSVNDDIKMKQFLKYDYDRYLRGRSGEIEKELPLYKVENQTYIHYGKGSVLLYALQDYIGEEKVNNAMKTFLEEYRYTEPPYPTSLDFLRHLDTQVPDSMKYLVTDWFKEITLYDYRLKEANYKVLPNGKYEVSMDVEAYKIKSDTIGTETKVKFNDWVDIGVYADDDEEKLMYYERVNFNKNEMNFKFEVDSIPAKAAIDPRRMLIERVIDDNVKKVEKL
jgi:ABC-2 type transport system permease protein